MNEVAFYTFGGGILLVFGLLFLYNKNFAWKLQEMDNASRGLKSERTASWEAYSTVLGYFLIVVGCVVLYHAFDVSEQQKRNDAFFNRMYNDFGLSPQKEK